MGKKCELQIRGFGRAIRDLLRWGGWKRVDRFGGRALPYCLLV
jgi:hypothetical protein